MSKLERLVQGLAGAASSRRRVGVGLALLTALTLAAYAPAFRAGWIWDDDQHVTANRTLEDLAGLRRIWLEPAATPQYYPLVHTSFWIEHHMWGARPLGYHAVNVLLHALNACLLWRLLRRLGVPGAWWAGALFALHPVHVESVAWVTERKNVLSGALYLGAFLQLLRAVGIAADADGAPAGKAAVRRDLDWGAYAAGGLLFIGALGSKTVTATLPAALLLAIWWRRGRLGRRDAALAAPLFALGASLACVTVWLERHHVGARGQDFDLGFIERLLIAGRALWSYAAKLAWPFELTFIYPRWSVDAGAAGQYAFPIAAAAVLALTWALRGRLGRGPFAALAFFGGTLLPALGFIDYYPMLFSFMADHFQYLASAGLLALAAAAGAQLAGRFLLRPAAAAAGTALGAALLIGLGCLTARQTTIYRDPETLWLDTLAKNPGAWIAHANLGTLVEQRGASEAAVEHYRAAIQLNPRSATARSNLGKVLTDLKRFDEARAELDEAVRLAPLDPSPRANLAAHLALAGDSEAAIQQFQVALGLAPRSELVLTQLATLLVSTGRAAEAEPALRRLLELSPHDPQAHLQLGLALGARGAVEEAIPHFEAAARAEPAPLPHFYLGQALVATGREERAIAHYELARAALPDWAEPLNSLAWLRATSPKAALRDPAQAVELARAAVRLTGDSDAGMLDTLAAALAAAGRFPEAIETASRASELAADAHDPELAAAIASRLELYRSGSAYREPPAR